MNFSVYIYVYERTTPTDKCTSLAVAGHFKKFLLPKIRQIELDGFIFYSLIGI